MAIKTFDDVLALWTPAQLSRVLGVRYGTVAAMYQRGWIAPAYWPAILEAAKARGEVLTAEMMIGFIGHRRPRTRAPGAQARASKRIPSRLPTEPEGGEKYT
jgi:hypothetical protein